MNDKESSYIQKVISIKCQKKELHALNSFFKRNIVLWCVTVQHTLNMVVWAKYWQMANLGYGIESDKYSEGLKLVCL